MTNEAFLLEVERRIGEISSPPSCNYIVLTVLKSFNKDGHVLSYAMKSYINQRVRAEFNDLDNWKNYRKGMI